ncbi:MAG: PP2C family serine/threonine-protein phosphatase [Candidatus Solibacter sp.]
MQLRLRLNARHDSLSAELLLRLGAAVRETSWEHFRNPWTGASLSDPGCKRSTNEDRCAFVVPSEPELLRSKGVLGIVADGMGGHAAGEVASAMAVDIVSRNYFGSAASPRSALLHAFQRANHEIFQVGQQEERRGLGTTCTALAIIDRQVVWVHIGDSRLYRLRRGRVAQLTEDDSEVHALIRRGWITAQEARHHPRRNLLCRALGVDADIQPSCSPESATARWSDRYLLCSDGLHDTVEESELRTTLARDEPEAACAQLIQLARASGGPDNITGLIIATH